MKPNLFHPRFQSLPETLPIFPLPGVILLPRAQLPLNIFEPRYLNMTLDALGQGRMIGMIQPDPARSSEPNAIYPTGCAGRITSFTETGDGRLLIVLTGVCRFDVGAELELVRGYRRVEPIWSRFADDLSDPDRSGIRRDELLRTVRVFLEERGIALDPAALEKLGPEELVNTLAMGFPVSVTEKQALLEAPGAADRARVLMALATLGRDSGSAPDTTRH